MARPEFFWWFLISALFLFSLSIVIFSRFGKTGKDWLGFLILPIIFIGSLSIYSGFLENKLLIHILLIGSSVFSFNYLNNSFKVLMSSDMRKGVAIENLSSYGNLLACFFIASSAYGFRSFFGISTSVLAILLFFTIVAMVFQNLWANSIKISESKIFLLVLSLLLYQIAIAIYFLPLSYNALGLILAICYYMLIGISKYFLRGNVNRRSVKLYLILGFLSIITIFISSRWI